MASTAEILLGFYGKNTDAVSSLRNLAEAQVDSSKYINATIDAVKVVNFWLGTLVKEYPLIGIGANVAALGAALVEIDQAQTDNKAVTVAPVIIAINAVGDLLADFALRQGAITLQPEVVMAGLMVKGVTTSLSYVNLVYGDTVLMPAKQTPPVAGGNSVPTIDPNTGEITLPAVVVTDYVPLDIKDINGNLLLSLNRSSSDGFGGFTLYGTDASTGAPLTVEIEAGQTTASKPVLSAQIFDVLDKQIGSLTQSQLVTGDREIVLAGANNQVTSTTIAQTLADGTSLTTIKYPSGTQTIIKTNTAGGSTQTDSSVPSDPNIKTITNRDNAGALTGTSAINALAGQANAYSVNNDDASGALVESGIRIVNPIDGRYTDSLRTPSNASSPFGILSVAEGGGEFVGPPTPVKSASALDNLNDAGNAFLALNALYNARNASVLGQAGAVIGGFNAGFALANIKVPELSNLAGGLGFVNSLLALDSAWNRNDVGGVVLSLGGSINTGAALYLSASRLLKYPMRQRSS